MEMQQTKISSLPRHELLRAVGQTAVQIGLFMIAVSTVMKQLGNLPDSPLGTNFKETANYQNNNRGYFD